MRNQGCVYGGKEKGGARVREQTGCRVCHYFHQVLPIDKMKGPKMQIRSGEVNEENVSSYCM